MWSPWTLYRDWAKISIAASEVIWRRSTTLNDAAETNRMVTEKFQVVPEVMLALWADNMKQLNRLMLGNHKISPGYGRGALKPIAKRVKANRRRLR